MFDTDSILWLQSWSSPVVTWAMVAVSILGYTRALVIFTVAIAFGWKLRVGLIVLLLIGMNAVITDVAKTSIGAPRPDAVDARVRPIGPKVLASLQRASRLARWLSPPREPSTPEPAIDAEGRLGFPSGHVSGATVFSVAIALLVGRRWIWGVTTVWIALMAVSRMYLGRHFFGDVVGGLAVGLMSVFIGLGVFHLRAAVQFEPATARTRAMGVILMCALGIATVALVAGTPDSGDAGRLLGLAAGTALLSNRSGLSESPPWRVRCPRLVLAAGGFVFTWLVVMRTLQSVGSLNVTWGRLVAIALPTAVMLVLPALAMRGARSEESAQV